MEINPTTLAQRKCLAGRWICNRTRVTGFYFFTTGGRFVLLPDRRVVTATPAVLRATSLRDISSAGRFCREALLPCEQPDCRSLQNQNLDS